MGECMKFLILRKRRIFKKQENEKILWEDVEIEIVYIFKVSKKIRRQTEMFDGVFSLDFKEFFKETDLLKLFAKEGFEKIALRHGGANREVLEVQVDVLNEDNAKILTSLALNARYVIVHSTLNPENFDFLCETAGVCPEVTSGEFKENLVVYFGEEFFIKHLPTERVYYNVLLYLPEEFDEYFLPEGNMIFSEYIKAKPNRRSNVKIRELMSK